MKTLLFICLLVVLVIATILGGCGKEAPAPTTTPAPTTSPTSTPTPTPTTTKPIELKITHTNPPTHLVHIILEEWAQKVEDQTGGRVKSTIFSVNVLHPPLESYQALINGITDITFFPEGHSAAQFALNTGVSNHTLGCPSAQEGVRVRNEIINKIPAVAEEFKDVHILWLTCNSPANIHTIPPVRTMADFGGLELRAPPGIPPIIEALGAVPVSMPMSDTFLSIEKGIVQGVSVSNGSLQSFRLAEVKDYTTVLNLYTGAFCAIMNKDTWNSLPSDVQNVINGLNEWGATESAKRWDQDDAEAVNWAKDAGHEFIYPDAAEKTKMYEAIKTKALEPWGEETEAEGKPGKAIVAELNRLMDEYSE